MNGITESTFPIGQITIGETLVSLIADAVVERLNAAHRSDSQSPWLDVAGAAAYLNTTSDAVRKSAQRGLLPGHQPYGPGSRWFFHVGDLDGFITGDIGVARSRVEMV